MLRLIIFLFLIFFINANVPLSHFYPYGFENGDNELPHGDDGTYQINLNRPFPYFGIEYNQFWLSIDGIIKLKNYYVHREDCSSTKISLSAAFIGPYITDLNTMYARNAHIYYGQTTENRNILSKAENDISRFVPEYAQIHPVWAFVATWINVPSFYGPKKINNTFQAVLTTNGQNSFAIFYYNQLHPPLSARTNGWAGIVYPPGKIQANRECKDTFIRHHLADHSNIDSPGKWVYRLDDATFLRPSTTTFAPPTTTASISTSSSQIPKNRTKIVEDKCVPLESVDGWPNVDCGPRGYLLGFGRRHCDALYDQWRRMDREGRELVQCLMKCWMELAIGFIDEHSSPWGINCTALWMNSHSKHAECYRTNCPQQLCAAFGNRNIFARAFSADLKAYGQLIGAAAENC